MIISHAHKYVFLETPRTASTAINAELREFYGGEEILHKHANFSALPGNLKRAGYTVFAGVRNPLDDAASLYQKLTANKDGVYTYQNGPWVDARLKRLYRLVHGGASFSEFLKDAFPGIYCSRASVNRRYCDAIIRFEYLQDDFRKVLDRIGLKPTRPLPVKNATVGKRHYSTFYEEVDVKQIAKMFGPFMIEWGYLTENDPAYRFVTRFDFLKYECMKWVMGVYQAIQGIGRKKRQRTVATTT